MKFKLRFLRMAILKKDPRKELMRFRFLTAELKAITGII